VYRLNVRVVLNGTAVFGLTVLTEYEIFGPSCRRTLESMRAEGQLCLPPRLPLSLPLRFAAVLAAVGGVGVAFGATCRARPAVAISRKTAAAAKLNERTIRSLVRCLIFAGLLEPEVSLKSISTGRTV
jgi:hypothetical protein